MPTVHIRESPRPTKGNVVIQQIEGSVHQIMLPIENTGAEPFSYVTSITYAAGNVGNPFSTKIILMKRVSGTLKRYPATCHFHQSNRSFRFVNKPLKLPEQRNGQAQRIHQDKNANSRPDNDVRDRLRERSDNIFPQVLRLWLFPAWSARRIRHVRTLVLKPQHRPNLILFPASYRDHEEQCPHSCRQPYQSLGMSRKKPQSTPGKNRLRQGSPDRVLIMARFPCSPDTSF